jgi:hypothetical protein
LCARLCLPDPTGVYRSEKICSQLLSADRQECRHYNKVNLVDMDGHQRGTFCIDPFVRSQGSLQQEATVSPSSPARNAPPLNCSFSNSPLLSENQRMSLSDTQIKGCFGLFRSLTLVPRRTCTPDGCRNICMYICLLYYYCRNKKVFYFYFDKGHKKKMLTKSLSHHPCYFIVQGTCF